MSPCGDAQCLHVSVSLWLCLVLLSGVSASMSLYLCIHDMPHGGDAQYVRVFVLVFSNTITRHVSMSLSLTSNVCKATATWWSCCVCVFVVLFSTTITRHVSVSLSHY